MKDLTINYFLDIPAAVASQLEVSEDNWLFAAFALVFFFVVLVVLIGSTGYVHLLFRLFFYRSDPIFLTVGKLAHIKNYCIFQDLAQIKDIYMKVLAVRVPSATSAMQLVHMSDKRLARIVSSSERISWTSNFFNSNLVLHIRVWCRTD